MNRIKELREDLDMRQIDVSRKTGIDQRTLSNYETGKTNPDSFAIIKLSKLFNVSTDYLLGLSNNETDIADKLLKKIDVLQTELTNLKELVKKLY